MQPVSCSFLESRAYLKEKIPTKVEALYKKSYKKEYSAKVKNYRPVSVLPTLSKIEQLMQMEISKYINQFLSPFLHSYRQGFSTQTALVCLIEKCKWYLDENSFAVAILMDLSKALDTINWDFLNCETSYGYGFGKNVLGLVYSYLKNRKQGEDKFDFKYLDWSN